MVSMKRVLCIGIAFEHISEHIKQQFEEVFCKDAQGKPLPNHFVNFEQYEPISPLEALQKTSEDGVVAFMIDRNRIIEITDKSLSLVIEKGAAAICYEHNDWVQLITRIKPSDEKSQSKPVGHPFTRETYKSRDRRTPSNSGLVH